MIVKWLVCFSSIFIALAACRKGSGLGEPTPREPSGVEKPRVLARVNGLPVLQPDFLAALQAGRVGGVPELVLDEMLSFTLVLNECEAMLGGAPCRGPGPVHERAIRFMERLYPAERICRDITQDDYSKAFDQVISREKGLNPDPEDRQTREVVRDRICEARARELKREWIRALRKDAVVEKNKEAIEAAVGSE